MKTAAAAILLFTATAQAADETTPTCSSNESLLTIGITAKSINETLNPIQYSLSLQDVTSANTTFECTNCEFIPKELENEFPDAISSHETSICLPKDHCHRFLVGTNMERWRSERIVDDFDTFTLNWDGEDLLDGFNAYSFGRVDFGTCESACGSDEEAEFEFFLTRNQTEFDQLSWNLTGSDGVIYEGAAPEGSSLIHTIECVPKDDCMTFHIGYPYDGDTYYSVRFDGVMYADGEVKASFPEGKKLNIGNCQASDVCGEGEALFEAQLNFLDTFTKNDTEYYALANGEINWLLVQEDVGIDSFFQDFMGYEFGSSYELNRCIAEDKCAQFAINTRVIEGLDSYLVAENGKELTERVTHEDESMFDDYDFEGTTTTSTSACPANVWGEPEQSSAARSFGILSSFVGAAVVCLAVF